MTNNQKPYFLTLVSQVLLVTLLVSTACTHKREQLLGAEDFSKEDSSTEVASHDEASDFTGGEKPASEDLLAVTTPSSESNSSDSGNSSAEVTPSEGNSSLSSEQPQISAGMSSTEPSLTSPGETAAEASLTSQGENANGAALASEGGTATDNALTSIDGATSENTLTSTTPSSSDATTSGQASDFNFSSSTTNVDSVSPETQTTQTEKAKVNSSSKSKRSAAPSVPSSTVKKGKHVLNRYYFLRSGDTAKSLSQLFYGNDSHVKELISWNGPEKKWRVGKVMLYISADQPDDTEIDSFYNEQGVTSESYLVKAGDQLSTIAKEKYGDVRSWVEIANNNKIQSPQSLTPGGTLLLMPATLTSAFETKASVTAKIENHSVGQAPTTGYPDTIPTPMTDVQARALAEFESAARKNSKVVQTPIEEPAARVLPEPSQIQKSKEKNLAAMELSSPETSSSVYSILVGMGLLLVAAFLFLMRRARERAHEEFME